jgi:hypothetical protein
MNPVDFALRIWPVVVDLALRFAGQVVDLALRFLARIVGHQHATLGPPKP